MNPNNISILCTVGPSTLNRRSLKKLEEEKVSLLRINLSHTAIEDIEEVIDFVQSNTKIPICLDSEGAQLRTGPLKRGKVKVVSGERVYIRVDKNDCTSGDLCLNHPRYLVHFQLGSLVHLDFDSATLQVLRREPNGDLLCRVLIGGEVGSNKAVNVENHICLSAITEKDVKGIELGLARGIKAYALSFAQTGEDVAKFRGLIGSESFLISKVESNDGIRNLEEIVKLSDGILIDRGDLSRQQYITTIPFWQKEIIKRVKSANKQIYVATNLLESMVEKIAPTRAEVNDIANTIMDGVDGLVLAAETAIGKNPISCVRILKSVMNQYRIYTENGMKIEERSNSGTLPPVGGELALAKRLSIADGQKEYAVEVELEHHQFLDFLQISHGGYSPLRGFMNSQHVENVLSNYTLADRQTVWTIPIILQVGSRSYDQSSINDKVALRFRGKLVGFLNVEEKFKLDLDEYTGKLFGTDSVDHPGVAAVRKLGENIIAGEVEIVDGITFNSDLRELTPEQTRKLFELKGWSQVVGFHTRNIPHNGHVYIQKKAYDIANADGIFINPVSTRIRETDFSISEILNCYDLLERSGEYAGYNTLIGSLAYYPRFAGPREAILTAICRQNYGCSHFIIGRDHTGVNGYYGQEDNERLIKTLSDRLEIELLLFNEVYFCSQCRSLTDGCSHGRRYASSISGTLVRDTISKGTKIEYPLINRRVISYIKESRVKSCQE